MKLSPQQWLMVTLMIAVVANIATWIASNRSEAGSVAKPTAAPAVSTAAELTLPSPYYLSEDIQYFQAGPEFKLQQESAAMKADKSDLEAQQLGAEAP